MIWLPTKTRHSNVFTQPQPDAEVYGGRVSVCNRCKAVPLVLVGTIYRSAAVPRLVTRSKVKTCSWGASTQQPKRRRRSCPSP